MHVVALDPVRIGEGAENRVSEALIEAAGLKAVGVQQGRAGAAPPGLGLKASDDPLAMARTPQMLVKPQAPDLDGAHAHDAAGAADDLLRIRQDDDLDRLGVPIDMVAIGGNQAPIEVRVFFVARGNGLCSHGADCRPDCNVGQPDELCHAVADHGIRHQPSAAGWSTAVFITSRGVLGTGRHSVKCCRALELPYRHSSPNHFPNGRERLLSDTGMAGRTTNAPGPSGTVVGAVPLGTFPALALGWLATALASVALVGAAGVAPLHAAQSWGLFGLVAAWVVTGVRRHLAGRRFGLANAITLSRAVIACVFGALIGAGMSSATAAWVLVLAAFAGLMLDGADGWAARRYGLASRFGAKFDTEVDSLFTLILSILVWQQTGVGIWVLSVGLLRYAFVCAGRPWPWLAAPLPASRRRKAVCVIVVAALAICLAPVMTTSAVSTTVAAALVVLAWSFAVDIVWLRRRRHRRDGLRAQARSSLSAAGPGPKSTPGWQP